MSKKTKALPQKSLREMMSDNNKASSPAARSRQRMFDAGFRAGERSGSFDSGYRGPLLRDAKKEIKELKKKVDLLHSTIGFLLTR